MASKLNGFFAYPSEPPSSGEAIRAAIEQINRSNEIALKSWEQCRISGKVIIHEICKQIHESAIFCADLTGANANVMFELGFAIARDKRIWLIIDSTLSESKKQFEQIKLLTTLGHVRYSSSLEIVSGFWREQPYLDLTNTVFRQVIEPHLTPIHRDTVLYLKSRHETEASVQLSKRISTLGRDQIQVITDDPHESAIQPLAWYGAQVYSAYAAICHLTFPEREGARLHNARHALIAGMAFGMDKKLLMLAEGNFLAPIDYRDLLRNYITVNQALRHLDDWLNPIRTELITRHVSQHTFKSTVTLATELKALEFGEFVAENEADALVDDYFVETAPYRDALAGKYNVYVGRKGSGKTANFLKLSSELAKDRRNLVCVIKPVAYELQGVIELLRQYKERDTKGYAVESLWKFLLYSEIANAAFQTLSEQRYGTLSQDEDALVRLVDQEEPILKEDFAVRLEQSVEGLLRTGAPRSSVGESRIAISEALHQGILKQLRILLGNVLSSKQRVAVLVDNLDKAWDKQSDLGNLAEFLLGLLSATARISGDFARRDSRRQPVNVTLAVFLRSDIFDRLMEIAREPDKIPYSKLSWRDPETLLRVVEGRFIASHAGNVGPEELWTRYFCPTVKSTPTKQYLVGHALPRPRDLLFLTKAAVSMAINRGHPRVEESDVTEAEKHYSQFALETILVENAVSFDRMEGILYEFIGASPYVSREDVEGLLSKSNTSPSDFDRVIDQLCGLSFLGLEVGGDDFRFAEDPHDLRKHVVLARKFHEKSRNTQRYMINPAFWAFLEVNTS